MRLLFTFIYSLTIILIETWTQEIESKLRLVVSPAGNILVSGQPLLIRKVDDSLNLTCRLENQNQETLQNYNISWNWQYSMSSNANRVMVVSLSHNEANLVFVSLKEADSGEYTCKCPELQLSQNVRVKVKSFKKYCSDKNFLCSTGQCIGRHYMCDGRIDCKDGSDESFDKCGANACEGKVPCEDGRCIPTSWCCDEMHDPNCTVKNKPKCCLQLLKPWHDADQVYSEQHFNDMGFLQTTIYTVIGCAMAFMFIVTILVIAICRVHIKRTIVSRCPLNHQHVRPGSPLPLYDLDMFLDRHSDTGAHPGFLVTYNINNGVQFVGRPVDPPPYCEVIDTPPREGPPPPYVSRENVAAAPESIASENVQCNTENTDENTQETSGEDICSSPSVSGLNTNVNSKQVFNESSDSESDSMESDALLSEATVENKDSKCDEAPRVIRSLSVSANISNSPPNSFINNITAVSKTLIGSLKRQTDEKSKNKQIISQKSIDNSEPCDIKVSNTESDNFKMTHSAGDLSPVNADIERLDYLTLPLRESFIGVRNDEV